MALRADAAAFITGRMPNDIQRDGFTVGIAVVERNVELSGVGACTERCPFEFWHHHIFELWLRSGCFTQSLICVISRRLR